MRFPKQANKRGKTKVPNEKSPNKTGDNDHEQKSPAPNEQELSSQFASNKVKFEIYGEEMIEKHVKLSGNSGRVYLPPNWVGHKVKIIRL
jgi:putative transposon-encoded protein